MALLFQINVTANWGSTGMIAEGIGQVALDKGWRSVIAYGRGHPSSSSELIRIGTDLDMRVHALYSRLLDNQGLMSARATRKLVGQIETLKPDIIHLHNIHGYYLNYPILFNFLKNAKIPIVWTLHDCWSFTGHCAHFVTADCYKWESGCADCPLKSSYPKSIFLDKSCRNYIKKRDSFCSVANMTFVPVSRWIDGYLKESFLKNYPSTIIHNGIDTDLFKPQNQGANNEIFKILGVASVWDKSKGLDGFIELSKMVSSDSQIVLVGVTKEQMKLLPDNIVAVERTNDVGELVNLYSSSDVFVNLTYADTFPTTNLEALACGTPVITYRTGGSPEAVSEDTGLVVTQGDLQGVLNAINEIKRNGKKQYTTKCRERAVRLFRKEDRYNDYIRLYDSILNQ